MTTIIWIALRWPERGFSSLSAILRASGVAECQRSMEEKVGPLRFGRSCDPVCKGQRYQPTQPGEQVALLGDTLRSLFCEVLFLKGFCGAAGSISSARDSPDIKFTVAVLRRRSFARLWRGSSVLRKISRIGCPLWSNFSGRFGPLRTILALLRVPKASRSQHFLHFGAATFTTAPQFC